MIANTIRLVHHVLRQYPPMHLLLGIGNDLLGDDGVGPFIAQNLHHQEWISIDGGIIPENFIHPIRKYQPDAIVIIDAVDMNLKPGSIRIIPPAIIRDCGIGTHQLPLTFLTDQLGSICNKVTFIGIQPGTLDPDSPLTDPVMKAAETLIPLLCTGSYTQLKVLEQEC